MRTAATIAVSITRLTMNEPTTESGVLDTSAPPSASVVTSAHARRSSSRRTNARTAEPRVVADAPYARSASSITLMRSVSIPRIRLDDVAHQPVPHDVDVGEVVERDPVDPREDSLDLHQPRFLPFRQVDLRLVARDDDL